MSCHSQHIFDVLPVNQSLPCLLPRHSLEKNHKKNNLQCKSQLRKLRLKRRRLISVRSQNKHLQAHHHSKKNGTSPILRIQALETENSYLRTQIHAIQVQLLNLQRDLPHQLNSTSTTPSTSFIRPIQSETMKIPPPTIRSFVQAIQTSTLSRVGCCDTVINEGNRPTLYASLSGVDPRSTCQGTTSGSTPTTFDTFSASNTGNESHRETSFIPQGSVVEDIFNSYCCSCDHRYQHPGCQYHRDEPLRNFHSTNSTRSNSASATGSGSSSAAPPSFNCERSSSPSIQLQQE